MPTFESGHGLPKEIPELKQLLQCPWQGKEEDSPLNYTIYALGVDGKVYRMRRKGYDEWWEQCSVELRRSR